METEGKKHIKTRRCLYVPGKCFSLFPGSEGTVTVVHPDPTKLSTWFGTCVTKWGHVGWPGTATQPRDEADRPQGGQWQWYLQTCSWLCCRCHINVFSVLTLLQFKSYTLREPPGQGKPSFPCPGTCVGRSPQRVQPRHDRYQPL